MFVEDEDPEENEEEGSEESESQGSTDESAGNDTTAGQVTMSQVDLDKMISKRVDRSKRSAITNLLSGAGFEKEGDLKEALGKLKEFEDSEKSETERIQGDLDTAAARVTELEGEIGTLQTDLKTSKLKQAVTNAAREAEFLEESFNDVWLVVQNTQPLLDGLKFNEEEGTITGAKAVVAKVAKDRPHWVGKPASGKIPGRVSSSTKGRGKTDGAITHPVEDADAPLVRL